MRKLTIGIIVASATLVVAGGIGAFFYYTKVMKPASAYREAKSLLEEGGYEEAQVKFEELGDYKDAEEQVTECDYQRAADILGEGEYDEAKEQFLAISDYKDSADLAMECDYQKASEILNEGNYEEAKVLFAEIENYKNSSDMVKECDYQKALVFYNDGDYENTSKILCNIYDYNNSKMYMYSMFTELAGQRYVDEYVATLDYFGSYMQNQESDMLDWIYSMYYGYSTSDSWSPDLSDADLKNMQSGMNKLNAMKSEVMRVFPQTVLDACNDEMLTSAYEQFNNLHICAKDMFDLQQAMNYLGEIMQGSTTSLEKDCNKAADVMEKYKTALSQLK